VRSLATERQLPKSFGDTTTGLPPLPPVKRKDNPEGPLRPHLQVAVNPNHGLWAFFRKKVDKDGNPTYETLEPQNAATDYSGRAWTAAELRRKSFKDLHTLWYVVLREQNLLATQLHELGRVGGIVDTTSLKQHKLRCRKTMARIKYVINERRLTYEGAVNILAEQKEVELAEKREKKAERELAKLAAETKARLDAEKPISDQETAGNLAAAGVFETIPAEPTPAPPPAEKEAAPEEEPKPKSDNSYII